MPFGVKVWKQVVENPFRVFKIFFSTLMFVCYAGSSMSPVKVHILVRIWKLPLPRPSRWGPPSPPRRARFPRLSPCQPNHLKQTNKQIRRKDERAASLTSYYLSPDTISRLTSPSPFFKAFSMSFSSSRACLFPGSFLRRVRMYFKAFSYSCKMNTESSAMKIGITQTGCRFTEADYFPIISFCTESFWGDHYDLQLIKAW